VILQTYPDDLEQLGPRAMAALVRTLAEDASVPVLLHLDHGRSVEMAVACLGAGFGSVMLDGAGLDLDDLVRAAERLARIAHAQGAALEVAAESFTHGSSTPTRPADARRLRQEGRADMVAVSVGSEHGRTAHLDLNLLARIADAVAAPLVLHGGSGIPPTALAAARTLGVVKVNVGSALYRRLRVVWEGSADAPSHRAVYARVRTALGEVVSERIRATGALGRWEVVAG
jgi:fructose/tagatose bisphosphate aldolase